MAYEGPLDTRQHAKRLIQDSACDPDPFTPPTPILGQIALIFVLERSAESGMSGNSTRQWLGSGLFLACMLAVGLGLSACGDLFGGTQSAPPVQADPRDQVRAASARCDSITDERTWLNCYYGAAQPARADLGLPPAPASQQNLVPPAR